LAAFLKKLIGKIPIAQKYGGWFKIEYATGAQEQVIRQYAKDVGFKDLRGFASYMKSVEWDYYDVIKTKYTD
jgi:hypothetical protein